jgi:putative ATP-dependent endonuclease of OLD family
MSENYIEKIHCQNFGGFRNRKLEDLKKGINILIGDNDTGKSTLLLAIDLVLGANPSRVETIGLDRLMNQQAVADFLNQGEKKFEDLPIMAVDLYLSDQGRQEFDGQHNIDEVIANGIYLRCRPRDDLKGEIDEILALENPAFPYEYYMVEIKGFAGEPITPYKKPLQHINIDNTKISNDYAARAYVKAMYNANADEKEKNQLKYGYRHIKDEFSNTEFAELNKRIGEEYGFTVKSNSKANLETDLSISHKGIDIENLGVGAQCFIRTNFALSKKTNIDVVLLEEPENHLSHTNMRKLIASIKEASQSQVFVATHSSLVCSRLDLRSAILFGSFESNPVKLDDLPEDTAQFFMKAPSSSVLEFVLSEKNLLVEGDAEYILMEALHVKATGSELQNSGLSVISVGGLSFPRYLDIARLLSSKVAVLTDNDGNIQAAITDRYEKYDADEAISVFYDKDEERRTFEICFYQDNTEICDELFADGRKTLTVQEFMLKNKSKAAFEIASKKATEVSVPDYINSAITWLNS